MNAADECRDQVAAIDAKNTLLDDLKHLIIDGAKEDDRSQQKALGPSEVGHPCLRKLAYGLMQTPKSNEYGDPLPSVVGTGAHSRMEEFARRSNRRLGRTRWLPEHKVTIRDGLAGTCDLVDLDTWTAIDWKFPSTSRMATYTSKGPSDTYRVQAHLYSRGLRNAGLPIETVAIAFIPRGGQLKHAHLWTEPYDDALVDKVLDDIDNVSALINGYEMFTHLDCINLIPATPVDCWVCPWHRAVPSGPHQCSGNKTTGTQPVPQGAFTL